MEVSGQSSRFGTRMIDMAEMGAQIDGPQDLSLRKGPANRSIH